MKKFFKDPLSWKFASKDRTYFVGSKKRELPKDLIIEKTFVRYATPETLQNVVDVYKKTAKMLDHYEIPYWAVAGTLLGAIRHKGVIPWDDDLDLGVPASFKSSIANMDAESFGLSVQPFQFGFYIHDLAKKEHEGHVDIFMMDQVEDEYRYSEPFHDPFHKEAKLTWHDVFPKDAIKKQDLFPLLKIPFEDTEIPVPHAYKDVILYQKGKDALTKMPFSNIYSPHNALFTWAAIKKPMIMNATLSILRNSTLLAARGGQTKKDSTL